jgi:dTDP-4-amino-4,6-dideoxygalactose transaminase
MLSGRVGSDVHYPIADHLQPAFANPGLDGLPETERLAKEIVTIRCRSEIEDAETSNVIPAAKHR